MTGVQTCALPISSAGAPKHVDTWKIIEDISAGRAKSVVLVDKDQTVQVTLTDDSKEIADFITGQGTELTTLLKAEKDKGNLPDGYDVVVPRESFLATMLMSILPVIFLFGLLFFFMSQTQGTGRVMQFGKSRAKQVSKDTPQTTFADVAGDRKSTRLNSSHMSESRMPSSA